MSYIKREAIHKMLDEMLDINIGVGAMMSEQCVRELIEDTPTADVVEVVRCKDCNHFTKEMLGDDLECICKSASGMVNPAPDFYCSYGERRAENGKS